MAIMSVMPSSTEHLIVFSWHLYVVNNAAVTTEVASGHKPDKIWAQHINFHFEMH